MWTRRVSARIDHCLGAKAFSFPMEEPPKVSEPVISTSPSKYAARLLPGSVPPASDVGAWAKICGLLPDTRYRRIEVREEKKASSAAFTWEVGWNPVFDLHAERQPWIWNHFASSGSTSCVLNRDSVLTWSRIVGFNREILNHKTCFDSRMYRDVIHEHV